MATDFFFSINTVEEVKKHYRDLARKNHPDLGGSLEVMQEINAQYHKKLLSLNNISSDGHVYKYNQKPEQSIMDKLHEFLKIPNLDISLIGVWIWITGDTKPVKEELKLLGSSWHSKRKMWYWKPIWSKIRSSNPGSLSELAIKYGYQKFQSDERKQLVGI
jgi:hypothetical protein